MIEQMKIGVTLVLKGDATPKIKEFRNAVQSATRALEIMERRLGPINAQVNRLNDFLYKLNPQLRRFYEEALEGKRSMDGLNNTLRHSSNTLSKFDKHLSTSAQKIMTMSKAASLLKDELEGIAAAGTSVAGVGLLSGRGGKHSGIHLMPTHFGRIGFTGAAIGVGLGIMGLHSTYEESKNYQRAYAQFKQQGFNNADNAKANQIASTVTSPGISNIAMMNALTDASMATKNAAMGRFLAPYLADIALANKTLYGDFSRKQEQNLIKFAEIRGGSDQNAILRELELGQKLYSSTGGRVQPSDLLNFVKMSQTAGYHLTDQALYKLEPSIQEMGGYKTGTALQTGFNQLITGKGMSTAEARDLTKLDILKPGGVVYDPLHRRLLNKPGTLTDEKLFQTDPVSWLQKDYFPALAKAGITSEDQIVKSSGYDFGRTYAALVSNILKNQDKIARAGEMNPQAKGIEASKQAALNTPAGREAALGASYSRFKKSIGDLTGPSIMAGMQSFEKIFDFLTMIINGTNKLITGAENIVAKLPSPYDMAEKAIDKNAHTAAVKAGQDLSKVQEPSIIYISMDGRLVAQAITPHLNHSMYLTQIQQPNTFMSGMTPMPVGTGAPWK